MLTPKQLASIFISLGALCLAMPCAGALQAPAWITASGGAASVTLNWASSPGATAYEVYRGTSSGGETALFSGIKATTYTDSHVNDGMTYYYKVVALNGVGSSGYSSEAVDFPNATGATGDINLARYALTFDEEFNSLSLSSSSPKGAATWFGYPPNGATGWFSSSGWNPNAFGVTNGVLNDLCWSNSTPINGANWQSGFMCSVDTTEAGFAQEYGYFEMRCQMPNAGKGAWPAFWLSTIAGLNKGTNEEVDIFEWYGNTDTPGSYQAVISEGSINWNPDGSHDKSVPSLYSPATPMPGGAYPWEGYHIYGCLINSSNITWYIDGLQANQVPTPTAHVTTPFYIMIDYAIGGTSGWPITGTPFNTGGSSSFLVDWVRVYAQLTQATPPTIVATPSGANLVLTFPTQSGFQYQVEYKNSLNDPEWNLLGGSITGNGVVQTTTDTIGQTSRFYRVQAQ
jgi:hypothetical protein